MRRSFSPVKNFCLPLDSMLRFLVDEDMKHRLLN